MIDDSFLHITFLQISILRWQLSPRNIQCKHATSARASMGREVESGISECVFASYPPTLRLVCQCETASRTMFETT